MRKRQEIIHHHAIAVDWLVAQLAQATGKDPDRLRILAFEVALEKADRQDEAYLDAVLKTNLKAFKRAGLNRIHGAQHGKSYRLGVEQGKGDRPCNSYYRDSFLAKWRSMPPVQQERFILSLLDLFGLSLGFVDRLSAEVDAEFKEVR